MRGCGSDLKLVKMPAALAAAVSHPPLDALETFESESAMVRSFVLPVASGRAAAGLVQTSRSRPQELSGVMSTRPVAGRARSDGLG